MKLGAGRVVKMSKQIVPFEMVDAVLADCGAVQRRVRKLPARVVVYLLLAAALFEQAGYLAVWRKLTGALDGAGACGGHAAAMWQARTRLGPAPLRALFDLLRGPRRRAAHERVMVARAAGVRHRRHHAGRRRTPRAHRARLGKQDNQYATAGYPQIRLVALVACGTRAIIDAVFGPTADGETAYGHPAAALCCTPGMIVLLDRGCRLQRPAGGRRRPAPAHFLARLSASRKPPVLRRLPDGSFLSVLGSVKVRIIECQITIATTAGTPDRDLPAGDHPARPRPAPRLRAGQALPPALGNRVRLLRDQKDHARPPRPARAHPARHHPGDLRPADRLPGAADRDHRHHHHRPRRRPRPGQLHHRPPSRPRPGHPGRERDRRQKPSTWPAPSAATSWPTCCPPAGCASAPGPSNGRCPATPTRACAWTGAPTRRPISIDILTNRTARALNFMALR